ncbi:MAG: hypothetical protein ACTSUL_04125 [Promethearchaeota archaeon]
MVCCPGSLQVNLLILAITTFGWISANSFRARQSTNSPMLTPHSQMYTPILISSMVCFSDKFPTPF